MTRKITGLVSQKCAQYMGGDNEEGLKHMRKAKLSRKTAETEIEVKLNLDGTGQFDNRTGVGFFDHMLDQLARHSLIDLTVLLDGDDGGAVPAGKAFVDCLHAAAPVFFSPV